MKRKSVKSPVPKKSKPKTSKSKTILSRPNFFKKKLLKQQHKKKPINNLKFPNIYRIITEKKIIFLAFFILAVLFVIVLYGLFKTALERQELDIERHEIIKEIRFWQAVVEKYDDYRDAYFQLAVLEYRLGNFSKSRDYLDKVIRIDPNYEKGIELGKILSEKEK